MLASIEIRIGTPVARVGAERNRNHAIPCKTMKNFLSIIALAFFTTAAWAQPNVATQNVNITVNEIAILTVTGGAVNLTIDTATAGDDPAPATASVMYNVSTNGSDKKITAALDNDMPSGLTLTANMAAPASASSAGALSLSSSAVDLVTGISTLKANGLDLSYEASATLDAAVGSVSRTVTYTITDN